MARQTLDSSDLERELLRHSVHVLAAGRHRCADCGRTPLVGERLYVYAEGLSLCELCRPHRAAEPVARELIRSGEEGHTVRITRRAA